MKDSHSAKAASFHNLCSMFKNWFISSFCISVLQISQGSMFYIIFSFCKQGNMGCQPTMSHKGSLMGLFSSKKTKEKHLIKSTPQDPNDNFHTVVSHRKSAVS